MPWTLAWACSVGSVDGLRAGTVFLADCPARLAIEIIANNRSVVTLFALTDGPERHSQLVALSGGILAGSLTALPALLRSPAPSYLRSPL